MQGLVHTYAKGPGPLRVPRPSRGPDAVAVRPGRPIRLSDAFRSVEALWRGRPTLQALREAAALVDGFDACPVTLQDGLEGIAAVLPGDPDAGKGLATGFLLMEDADGLPCGVTAAVGLGTSFADAVEMLVLAFLAEPLSGYRAWDMTVPFSGSDERRGDGILKAFAVLAGGDGPLARHASDTVRARLGSAIRHARVTPRFRLGLVAKAECDRYEPILFRRDASGDNARAFLVGYPLPARYTSANSTGDGMASTVRWLGRDEPGLTPAHVRRLGGEGPRAWADALADRDRDYALAGALLQFAGGLPVDWMPAGEERFAAFAACSGILLGLSRASGQPVRQLAAPSRGDWVAFHASLTRDPWLRHVTYQVSAAVDDLAFKVLYPLVGDLVEPRPDPDAGLVQVDALRVEEALKDVARQVLYVGKSATGVLEAARRWHATVAEINLRMPFGGELPARWPPLFEPVTAPNGLRIVSLATAVDLHDEGRSDRDASGALGLDHCIGTSQPSAAEGHRFYASIRKVGSDGSFERVSTLEIGFDRDGAAASVQQNRGRSNAPASAEAVEAADWLMAHHPLAPWRAYHRHRSVAGDANLVGYRCRYDWRAPGFVDAAVDAYRPVLPAHLSALTPAGLREALDLDGVVTPHLEARRRLRKFYTSG